MTAQGYSLSGTGDPVLMLHSSMSSKSQWKALAKQLSTSYQVIAMDLSGYGDAAFPFDPKQYSLGYELNLIEQVLTDAGVVSDQKIQVIGHSFGGATALRWCFENQDRVAGLHIFEPVAFHLLEAPCEGLSQVMGVIHNLYDQMGKKDRVGATQTFIDYWSGKGAFQSFPPHIQDVMVSQIEKVILDFEALLAEPLKLDDYATLKMPVTLIKGTQSPISSRTVAQRLKECLQDVDFYQVECGHMGPITHPDLINDILVKKLLS